MHSNPKRNASGKPSDCYWGAYYAGYSEHFVRHTFGSLDLQRGATVMDPWNGSGTTTRVAQRLSYGAQGFDLNPVMVIAAKARHLGHTAKASLLSLTDEIVSELDKTRVADIQGDHLRLWFDTSSTKSLRGIECGIRRLLVDKPISNFSSSSDLDAISPLAAFFYVALFNTVRMFVSPFIPSNPTWVKVAKEEDDQIYVPRGEVRRAFKENVFLLSEALANSDPDGDEEASDVVLALASSERLPLPSASVDAVVTSPPYCTRIDYAVATRPELAVVHLADGKSFRSLRDTLLGTTTVGRTPVGRDGLPSNVQVLLNRIATHPSKASQSYYVKTLDQYFLGLQRSVAEISRVMRDMATAVFVVQDSFFKDVHIDLQAHLIDMAAESGLSLVKRVDFPVGANMANLNRGARQYRAAESAVESVITLAKTGT